MGQRLPPLGEMISVERGFYRAISSCQLRPWGEIVRNDQNADSHDSNHADVSVPVTADQFAEILADTEAFFCDAPAAARVRFYTALLPPDLLDVAVRAGWETRLEESTWRAWPASLPPVSASDIPGLSIQHPATSDLESCHLIHEEDTPGESRSRVRRTWERLICSPNVTPLLARIDGEPAAVLAIVWLGQWGDVEAVKTRECFRRRGICTSLLRSAQDLALERKFDGLMLYDIDEAPDRIYARAGFNLIGKTQCAIAWRERS